MDHRRVCMNDLARWYPVSRSGGFDEDMDVLLRHESRLFDQLDAWLRNVRLAPVAGIVQGEICALLTEMSGRLDLQRALGGRKVYETTPVPSYARSAGRVAFEDLDFVPEVRVPYRLKHLRKSRLHVRHSLFPEDVLVVGDAEKLPVSEFLPKVALSSSKFNSLLKEASSELSTDREVILPLLTPFSGSPAWGAGSAGLESSLGSPEIDSWAIADYTSSLRPIQPYW